jgi:predicted GNAT family acetyltransferase
VWGKVGQDIDGEAVKDTPGYSIVMSADGKQVAIGAKYNKGEYGSNSGHVRVYDWIEEEGWKKAGQDIDGEAAGDQSGISVAMSADGTQIAIGAKYANGGAGLNTGHVRVYDWIEDEGNWKKFGEDIDGDAEGGQSGEFIAMPAYGNSIVIENSGGVRVYDLLGGLWTQLGMEIDRGPSWRTSVAMSADGTRIAIGSPYNAAENYSGYVRVYEVSGFQYPCVLHVFACVPIFCTNLNMSQSV